MIKNDETSERPLAVYRLRAQHRMHPEIFSWPNRHFYNSRGLDTASTSDETFPFKPYTVLSLNCRSKDIIAYYNQECDFTMALLKALSGIAGAVEHTYGIITENADRINSSLR